MKTKSTTPDTNSRLEAAQGPLDLSEVFSLREVKFRVIGLPPGLMQHSTRGAQAAAEAKDRKERGLERAKETKILTLEDEAALAAYPMGDGTYYHPAMAFSYAMLQAADDLYVKGASGKQRKASTDLQRNVRLVTERAIIRDPDTWEPLTNYTVDQRPARNANTGGLVWPVRVLWPCWATEITLAFNPHKVSVRAVSEAFVLGGFTIGVGSFRPTPALKNKQRGQGGPFGTYKTELIQE
jgi:hypothetical protein